jgi:hypothetical protein
VQSHGETVTALVRHFGDLDIARIADSGDRVFVTLPVLGIVSSSTAAARTLAVIALLVAATVVWHTIRAALIGVRQAIRSVVVAFVGIAALTGVVAVTWDALANRWAPADIVASFDDFDESGPAMSLVVVATMAIVIGAAYRMSARRGPVAVMIGSLGLLAAADVVFLLSQPLALPTTAWPLLAAACAAAAELKLRGFLRAVLLAMTALAPLLLLVPQILLWVDSPSDGAAPPVAVTALLLAALAPQLIEITGQSGDPSGG